MSSNQKHQTLLLEHTVFDRALAAVLTWLIPGAGYWLLGYRKRAVILAALVLGLFWTGELILSGNGEGQYMAVTREVHPIFFCLQAGNGLSTFLANWAWGGAVHYDVLQPIKDVPRYLNLGILFCVVSGMLNLLLVLNVLDRKTWLRAGEKDLGSSENEGTDE